MYELIITLPNLDKGASVELDGLGIFENGVPKVVTAEEAAAYLIREQAVVPFEQYIDNPSVAVKKLKKPTTDQLPLELGDGN